MAKKIADISHYQGEIDWHAARPELDMAIFRASIGGTADKKYLDYTALCGIPYGAYHYVKAGNAQEAREEARVFVTCADTAKRKPLFYIADIEYKAQTEETTEEVCVAFLRELRALGCGKIGLYINTKYKWASAAVRLCDVMWIPHWGKNDGNVPEEKYAPKYPCDIWQYTSKGSVAGIKGNVDLNLLKGNKPLEWFTEGWETEEPGEREGGGETMFTNLQLAAYCEQVYAASWVYWYGTCGYKCTKELYNRKKEQYPKYYTTARESGYSADIKAGRMCADCVGLIKSFFWKGGSLDGANKYQDNNCPDRSADGMFNLCQERGPIDLIPDIPGLVVHKSGHIGVYVGNGYTVEMKGFAYDCVKQKVSAGPWTEWGKLPDSMLSYVDGQAEPVKPPALGDRELSRGSTGEDVKEMQGLLAALGYNLGNNGIDGDFGPKTQAAVTAFQNDRGLNPTGVFDAATFKALTDGENTEDTEEPDTPDGGSAPAYILILEGTAEKLRLIQSAYGGKLAQVDSVKVVEV